MDLTKLNGIVEAIEGEAAQPAPSHNNLARLTFMAFKEVGVLLSGLQAPVSEVIAVKSPEPEHQEAEFVEDAPKKKPKRKAK